MMTPKVSIIILNWNGLADTIECLESLSKIDYPNYDVIVVDNNSYNDDVKIIREKFGGYVKSIIVNKSNLGFSGGNNVGIKLALENGAEVVLLLNNDTIVEPDFLNNLVEKSKSHPEVGILTPLINYVSSKDVVWFAGGHISKLRSSGFPDGICKHESKYSSDRFCNFASGCCMYVKKEVVEKIGFFDENFFLYLEDSDYSYRAYKAGFKILYAASSKIYHKVSSTTSKNGALLTLYYSTRNRLYFAKKNFGWYYYVFTVLFVITFFLKIISFKERKKALIILTTAFKDMFLDNMGKSDIFDNHI